MEIAIESSDELEQLRTRLRKMSDDALVNFGKAARSLREGPKMARHVQAPVGRGACGVETEASESAVINCSDARQTSRAEFLGSVHVRVRGKTKIFLCTSKNGQLDSAQTLGAQTCHRYTSAVSSSP